MQRKTLAEVIFENKRMCDSVDMPVLFEFNRFQSWIYPGETCAIVERRWLNSSLDEITVHLM